MDNMQELLDKIVANLNIKRNQISSIHMQLSKNTFLNKLISKVFDVNILNKIIETQYEINKDIQLLFSIFEEKDRIAKRHEENTRNNNKQIDYLLEKSKELDVIGENIRNNNKQIDYLLKKSDELDGLGENTRNNNNQIEYLLKNIDDIEYIKTKQFILEKNIERFSINIKKHSEIENNIEYGNATVPKNEDSYSGIDYFDFENKFRGSRLQIKNNQKQYIEYFEGKYNVLDIGCGRGEFLELLKEFDIEATGVDSYDVFVEYCKMNGLKAVNHDAIEYISELEGNIGGIFAGQIVEHLNINQIVDLCNLAYEKLSEGSYLVIETPNPTSLAIYTNAFYIDPSHIKPVHPLTLKYLLEKAGFEHVEIKFIAESAININIPAIDIDQIKNSQEINDYFNLIGELLFGSQDYAIIAKK